MAHINVRNSECTMILLLLASLFHVGRTIKISASPRQLHFRLCNDEKPLILASLEYNDEENVVIMARLLGCKEIPVTAYYAAYDEESEQFLAELLADRLLEHVFPHPELHPYFFPVSQLAKNTFLRSFILENFDRYSPGVVYLGKDAKNIYDDEQLRYLLSPVVRFPNLLGDVEAGRMAWKLGLDSGWEVDCSDTLDKLIAKIEQNCDINLLLIGALSIPFETLASHIDRTLENETLSILSNFLSEGTWMNAYQSFLSIIKERTSNGSEARVALWHGRLLLGALAVHPEQSHVLKRFFIEYFTSYDLRLIPPYIASKIVEQFRETKRLNFTEELDPDLIELLSSIEDLFSTKEGFWGGVSQYAKRFSLALEGGRQFDFPTYACDTNAAVRFFAEGKIGRGEKVLFHGFPTRPLLLQHSDGKISKCHDMVLFLETMTDLVFIESGVFTLVTDGLAIASRDGAQNADFWVTVGRLLIYNLIYRSKIGVRLSGNFWRGIYNGMNPLQNAMSGNMPRNPMRVIASELYALEFTYYFPKHIMLPVAP
ncbi:hypothetical protein PSACC_03083 [Paramicrosporidium saccamoebae]|uniref:Uncharacterized protein n=1 Tax=Paramicrosporidium saccamoebae TaxID=1246581 RepID=A0A2H9TH90_9FUNG|nr:hypothetical protein PSACC_03083 [Paramicrosporidium saccamoebae]